MRRRTSHRRCAFTLLEMVISIGLIVLLMAMMFSFYSRMLESRQKGEQVSRNVQLARVVLDRMSREVRQAVASIPGYGMGVAGDQYAMEVNTLTLPDRTLSEVRTLQEGRLPGQFDLRQVRYYVAWDEVNVDTNGDPVALGLIRRESRTYLRDVVSDDGSDQSQATEEAAVAFKEELYAPEIKYCKFAYFDGARWWDKWMLKSGNPLPQMVRMTIGFVPELPPDEAVEIVEEGFLEDEENIDPLPADRYSVVIRLQQADMFFGSRVTREASAFSDSVGL